MPIPQRLRVIAEKIEGLTVQPTPTNPLLTQDAHNALTNPHHAQAHVAGHKSGGADPLTGANKLGPLEVGLAHADLATVTPDQHHAQAHGNADHTAAPTPSTQAFGDAAVTGIDAGPSRGDHKHAMMANPVTGHEAAADPHTGYRLESVQLVEADIAADAVTNPTLANMVQQTVKGRAVGAGTGDPTDLTAAQVTAILDVFTSALKGLVPASGGGTANFLRADGIFAAPTASVADPNPQSYTPGSFTVDTGKYVILSKRLQLTGAQRVTAAGTARVRIT